MKIVWNTPRSFSVKLSEWLLLIVILFLPVNGFGYDFSRVRDQIRTDLDQRTRYNPERIAILFETQERDVLKKNFNLVELKRSLAHQLLERFQIVDPLIVHQILEKNQLSVPEIKTQSNILIQFSGRTESPLILFVTLSPSGENLAFALSLVTQAGETITQSQEVITPQDAQKTPSGMAPTSVQPNQEVAQQPAVDNASSSAFADFFANYEAPPFLDQYNDSWIYFFPTAMVPKDPNLLQINLLPKNLADTDIRLMNIRYETSVAETVQFGAYAKATNDSDLHSSYATLKYRIFALPSTHLAVGLQKRIFWNSKNPDFEGGSSETNAANKSKNDLTLTAMATAKFEKIGLLANLYLDNIRGGVGLKFLITSELKIFLDTLHNYYKDAPKKSEAVLGIQFHGSQGNTTSLAYDRDLEQALFGIEVSW